MLERCAICACVSLALTSGGSSYPRTEENLAALVVHLGVRVRMISPMFAIARSAALTSSLPMPRPHCVGLTATSDKYALSLGVCSVSFSAPNLSPFGSEISRDPDQHRPNLCGQQNTIVRFLHSVHQSHAHATRLLARAILGQDILERTLKNKSMIKFVASSTSCSSSNPITTLPPFFIGIVAFFTA